jgi:predicted nucleotidyltransferase component of viral defense system
MSYSNFVPEVRLLLRVLPFIALEKVFALKGGTAINMFIRNMPRLSVDIDLTYLPIESRQESLKVISNKLTRIGKKISTVIPDTTVTNVIPKDVGTVTGLVVTNQEAQIKIEVNIVIRGSVYEPIELKLCEKAQEEFSAEVLIQTLSIADIYGGKICAALDRQHPRDLFDVKLLLEEDGLTEKVRRSFVVYLASHDRPMNELLAPTLKDIEKVYHTDFQGMTLEEVRLADLLETRTKLIELIKKGLSNDEKQFLLSIKKAEPNWDLLGISGLEKLPAIQWKLLNIKKMTEDKRKEAYKKLETALYL